MAVMFAGKSPEEFGEAIASGTTTRFGFDQPFPVYVAYWTMVPDCKGAVHRYVVAQWVGDSRLGRPGGAIDPDGFAGTHQRLAHPASDGTYVGEAEFADSAEAQLLMNEEEGKS